MFSNRILNEIEPEEIQFLTEEGFTENPKDYYFACEIINNKIQIIITPKKLWDEEHVWSDSGWTPFILENHLHGYDELLESTFEPSASGATICSIKKDLKNRGFIENNSILEEAEEIFKVSQNPHRMPW